MLNYKKMKCCYCQLDFDDSDEIVICPVCGAPYHKACYIEHNKCAYEETHGTDLQWTPDEKLIEEDSSDSLNDSSSENNSKSDTDFNNIYNFFDDISESENLTIDDVSIADITAFVGSSSSYYITRFFMLKNKKINFAFNLCAGFLSVFWLSFRKMYKLFAGIFAVLFVFNIPSIILSYQAYTAFFKDLDYYYKYLDYNPLLYTPSQTLLTLEAIAQIVIYVVSIYLFFNANKIYMNHVIKSIKKIRLKYSDNNEYYNALRTNGGTSYVIPIVSAVLIVGVIIVIFLASYILPNLNI